jgi:hypothetical protein
MKKLIKDTLWSRLYIDSNGMRMDESKLETEKISVNLHFVQEHWTNWSQPERFDFARALSRKRVFSPEDEVVLQYLIRDRDDVIASTVANAVGRMRDRTVAVGLLLERMVSCSEPRANFYQALSNFEEQRVIRSLLAEHSRLERKIQATQKAVDAILDYISCCAALGKLTANEQYTRTITSYTTMDEEIVRNFARSSLDLTD